VVAKRRDEQENVTRYWIGALVTIALIGLAFARGFGVLALLVVPLFAWYMSRILVHGGFGLWHYATQGVKEEWNGTHYEFGGIKLRAEETDDGLVFLEDDLLQVIAQPRSKTLQLFGPSERVMLEPGKQMALTQAGCERLLTKCPHRDAKKLMLFLQREAFNPHERRAGRLKTTISKTPNKSAHEEES